VRTIEEAPRVDSVYCASYHEAVELLGKRWNGAIVAVLLAGRRRFSELVTSVPGLSERLLAERLRELESRKIVLRRVLPGPPVGVEYELTGAGRELQPAIEAISVWAQRWVPAPPALPPSTDI
jgi:DNA-binding HxlR family transcriptional regulator